ncbi:cell wall-active antibiotics response protein [Bacillus lacus]|uniref:Cell wall-active antibiotics response protein n=1 Tax=Metabacillus lacus TaxID=1983721 RepID=A0A7X2LXD7_9BACI|nr:cell wall-active antibiotics response protein LiaF [Metabacillus lacus]MRX71181.1 cell wall-active antibiotics response protein [Metabacillus lacus]
MERTKQRNAAQWILYAAFFLLLLELLFFDSGLIFSLLVSLAMIYIGKKKLTGSAGKILFWIGVVTSFFTIINMMTFRFLLLAGCIYFFVQYTQSKQKPAVIIPSIQPSTAEPLSEPLLKKEPLFKNVLAGRQQTPEQAYEWSDVVFQAGISDTIIDLSNTVLPDGEAVIMIRSLIGNVKVLVPYEVEVSVRHSVLYGSTVIFQQQEQNLLNASVSYQTENYDTAKQKIKIVTSMFTGEIEVSRI